MKASEAIEMLSAMDGDEEIFIDWYTKEEYSWRTDGNYQVNDEAWLYAVKRTSSSEYVGAEIVTALSDNYHWAMNRIKTKGSV